MGTALRGDELWSAIAGRLPGSALAVTGPSNGNLQASNALTAAATQKADGPMQAFAALTTMLGGSPQSGTAPAPAPKQNTPGFT